MYENIFNSTANFCVGPQSGTFCTVDYTTTPPLMHVKNSVGTIIRSYTFSPSAVLSSYPYFLGDYEFVSIVYIGPSNQTSYYDGAIFYTLERAGDVEVSSVDGIVVNYTKNVIRKWVIDSSNFSLVLQLSYVKESDDVYFYNGASFSVRHFNYSLDGSLPVGSDVITLPSTEDLAKYDTVLIGPSGDVTNMGSVEEAYIHSIDGNDVTLRTYSGYTPTKYEYLSGDPITIFKDILLFSDSPMVVNDGIVTGNLESHGYLYSLSQSSYGRVSRVEMSGIFSGVIASVWNPYFDCLTFNKGNNLIHLDVRDYKPIKSQVVKNTKNDRTTQIGIYALAVQDYDIYKLQKNASYVSEGKDVFIEWPTYNYVPDSLVPYTSTVTHYLSNCVLGYQGVTNLTVIVRDQFGVGLINKNVFITVKDESNISLTPYQDIVTDANGRCVIQCVTNGVFEGLAKIELKVDGASTSNGSEYIYEYVRITIKPYFYFNFNLISTEVFYTDNISVLSEDSFCQDTYITCQTRVSSPGGDWKWNGVWVDSVHMLYEPEYSHIGNSSYAAGRYSQIFNPIAITGGAKYDAVLSFDCKVSSIYSLGTSGQVEIGSSTGVDSYELYSDVSYFVDQVSTEYVTVEIPLYTMASAGSTIDLDNIVRFRFYWYAAFGTVLTLYYKNVKIKRKITIEALNCVSSYNTSNLIMSVYQPMFNQIETDMGDIVNLEADVTLPITNLLQTNSMMEEYNTYITDYLTTDDVVRVSQNYISRHIDYGNIVSSVLNQYVFIQEAVPAFWSEKNMTYVDYWIRLRPFAYSLNPDSLIIEVYEDSYLGVSEVLDITSFGTIELYDAGSGLLGIDFSYKFTEPFHNNALVYIEVTVYDEAAVPNLLDISYWFKIIADYGMPYLDALCPSINEVDVKVDVDITFDLNDLGEGVDIDTLEVYINNRSITVVYEEYSPGNFHITYSSEDNFNYSEKVSVFVKVSDRSDNENTLHDGWVFYCIDSSGPWFDSDGVIPGKCLEGVSRVDTDISMQVYAVNDTGLDYNSIKLEIGGKHRSAVITPIVYRLK